MNINLYSGSEVSLGFIINVENHVLWAWSERIGSAVNDLTGPKREQALPIIFCVFTIHTSFRFVVKRTY